MNLKIRDLMASSLGLEAKVTTDHDPRECKVFIRTGYRGPIVEYEDGTFDWWYNIKTISIIPKHS